MLRVEQIVRPGSHIKKMARSYPRRIMIVVFRALGRDSKSGCAEAATTGRDRAIDRRTLVPAKETDGCLFCARQRERVIQAADRAGNQPAVIAPGEREPGAVGSMLITEIRCLLECLVVVDAEYRPSAHIRMEYQSPALRTEIPCAGVTQRAPPPA